MSRIFVRLSESSLTRPSLCAVPDRLDKIVNLTFMILGLQLPSTILCNAANALSKTEKCELNGTVTLYSKDEWRLRMAISSMSGIVYLVFS